MMQEPELLPELKCSTEASSAVLTPETLDRGFKAMMNMSEARIRDRERDPRPYLMMPPPRVWKLARQLGYDWEASFQIIRPIGWAELQPSVLDEDTID